MKAALIALLVAASLTPAHAANERAMRSLAHWRARYAATPATVPYQGTAPLYRLYGQRASIQRVGAFERRQRLNDHAATQDRWAKYLSGN